MGAVRLLFHTELRRRWLSWLVVALLISVVAGLVLAAAAAGRRTDSAFPRFVAAHGFDAVVYATRPVPKVAHLPGVASATELIIPDTGSPTCHCPRPINGNDFGVAVAPTRGPSLFTLVSGSLPDPADPDQVLASFTLQQDDGVQVGTVIHVPFEAPSQSSDYNNPTTGLPAPKGPRLALQVVGIEASEFEFPSGNTPVYLLYTDRAFARTLLPHTGVQYQYYVRLRDGAGGITRFDQQVATLNLGNGTVGASSEDGEAATIQTSIHPQAIGWWILAALAALVGLAVVGQALARQSTVESEDYPKLAAIGVDRPQLLALGTARNLVVGVAGAIGAVAVAVVLSPIAPLGEARTAEASTGVSFDALVLPLGALATVAAVLVLGLWPAWRAARSVRADDGAASARPSAVVHAAGGSGCTPERGDRCPQRIGTKIGWLHHSPGLCPPRHGAGGHRTVRNGRLRRQPHPSDGHAQTVGRPRTGHLRSPERLAAPELGAQHGRHRHHRGCGRGVHRGRQGDRGEHRGNVPPGTAALLYGQRPAPER